MCRGVKNTWPWKNVEYACCVRICKNPVFHEVCTSAAVTFSARTLNKHDTSWDLYILFRGKGSLKQADYNPKQKHVEFSLLRTTHHFDIAKLQLWLAVSVEVLVNWRGGWSYDEQGYQKTFWGWESWCPTRLLAVLFSELAMHVTWYHAPPASGTILAHKEIFCKRGRISCKLSPFLSKC